MILVDPRLGSSKGAGIHGAPFVRALQSLGAEAKLSRLKEGDVSFWGNGPDGPVRVGIEVKTLSDCLSALDSKRLQAKQIPGLCQRYSYRYFVTQGIWQVGKDGLIVVPRKVKGQRKRVWVPAGYGRHWTFGSFLRTMNMFMAQAGVWWLRTSSTWETCWVVWALYGSWSDPWEEHSTFKAIYHREARRPSPFAFRSPSLARLWASDIPWVGWEYSQAAEDKFGSPRGLAMGTAKEWANLRREGLTKLGRRRPRIGMKKARQIVEQIAQQTGKGE